MVGCSVVWLGWVVSTDGVVAAGTALAVVVVADPREVADDVLDDDVVGTDVLEESPHAHATPATAAIASLRRNDRRSVVPVTEPTVPSGDPQAVAPARLV